jgi:hypothetical protein
MSGACMSRCPLTSASAPDEKQSALEGVLSTFGDAARYDVEPWDEHYDGRDGVRSWKRSTSQVERIG